jgi:hypothetical protein
MKFGNQKLISSFPRKAGIEARRASAVALDPRFPGATCKDVNIMCPTLGQTLTFQSTLPGRSFGWIDSMAYRFF